MRHAVILTETKLHTEKRDLPREARHAGLAKDQARGGAALEDTGGHPRQRADWGLPCGASRRGKISLFQYCWELLGTVLDSVAEQSNLGEESFEKAYFVDFARSTRLSHRGSTSVDIAFPRDCAVTSVARRARLVAERNSCINLRLVLPSCILMPWLGVLTG